MKSNFAFLTGSEPLARLGADAERFLWEEPDLALFRLRQFAESLTSQVYATRNRCPLEKSKLADRIHDLFEANHITTDVSKGLRKLKDCGNDAVHPEEAKGSTTTAQFRKDAEVCLREAFDLGLWLHCDLLGNKRPDMDFDVPPKPSGRNAAEARIARVEMELDAAKELADERGQLDAAEQRIAETRARFSSGAFTKKIGTSALALLQMKCDSISTSIDNHRGRFSPALDQAAFQERCRSLVETGDDAVWAEVSEYGNRLAVAELNAYRFAVAEDWCSTLVKARELRNEAGSVLVGDIEIRDWYLGAVLGTRGQARCFVAHLENDSAWLDLGLEDFARAEDVFVDSGDKQRQRVYQMHAHLERVRLGDTSDLPADFAARTWLEDRAEGIAKRIANGDARTSDLHADLFVLDVVLKAADLLKRPAPVWARDFAAALAREVSGSEPLEHPYEHLCGRLWLFLGRDCPNALREGLRSCASRGNDKQALVPLIAKAFVMERAFRDTGEAMNVDLEDFLASRPAPLVDAWNAYGLDDRFAELCKAGGLGPLRILPFNYA